MPRVVLCAMRRALPVLLLLSSCGIPPAPFVALATVDAASVVVLGRSLGDVAASAVLGQDCSIVRLDRGQSYCRPTEPPPDRPVFCTRSLGSVDCWANPEALAGPLREVADGPRYLTPQQEANRLRVWPGP